MKIQDIDVKNILLKLTEAQITIEDYWLLCLVYVGKHQNIITYLSIRSSYNNQFFVNLQEKGFLEMIHGTPSLDKLKVTDKFVSIFINEKKDEEFEEFIDSYRNIWPVGVKSMGQFPVRATRSICCKKMKDFFKQYPQFSKETILKATKLYIDSSSTTFYSGITTCNYFIEKENRGSLLSEYCELVDQSGEIGIRNDFSSKDV